MEIVTFLTAITGLFAVSVGYFIAKQYILNQEADEDELD